ncbi:MAG: hypothetical protein KatS3mg122_0129 [Caldimonas sp.]|nr:MAG: hypothetical protein KatS3mg122_0129 [Caldimonas sp.]
MMKRLLSFVALLLLVATAQALPTAAASGLGAAVAQPQVEFTADVSWPAPSSHAGGSEESATDSSVPVDPAVEFHAVETVGAQLAQPRFAQTWTGHLGARPVASPALEGLLRPPKRAGRGA